MKDALHGSANRVVVRIEWLWDSVRRVMAVSSCAAASSGLIALFLRTTSAAIALRPVGKRFVSARLADPPDDLLAAEFLQIIGGATGTIVAIGFAC